MAFVIQNRAGHLLVLPFNSGGTLHLAPGETSSPVEGFEIENNAKVKRLSKEGLVVVTESGVASRGEGSAAEGVPPGSLSQAGGKSRRGGSQN
ncbi:MAG TPA: hypothetical protein VLJ61_18935 [Pyrinomonadaceae bacterium]|nr:hypothetical protein [Pyrinomonadaceae bacterium]